jgi:micrococcal nuclease
MLPALLTCLVVGVIDGDSLRVRCDAAEGPTSIQIRLSEVDAPESGQAFGKRSKQHLSALCFRKTAQVTPKEYDRYSRLVARVSCDGLDASIEQVRAGMAWRFTWYSKDPSVKAVEAQARENKTGLWRDAQPVAPWEWGKAKNAPQ